MTATMPAPLLRLVPLFRELEDDRLPCHRERVRIREAAGWSRNRLGRHLGCAQRNVCNWEKPDGSQPTPVHRVLYRVALEELEKIALQRCLEEAYQLNAGLSQART